MIAARVFPKGCCTFPDACQVSASRNVGSSCTASIRGFNPYLRHTLTLRIHLLLAQQDRTSYSFYSQLLQILSRYGQRRVHDRSDQSLHSLNQSGTPPSACQYIGILLLMQPLGIGLSHGCFCDFSRHPRFDSYPAAHRGSAPRSNSAAV